MWNEFLSGMPARVQRWYNALARRWWITLLFGAITFLIGASISGIVEGESLNFWNTSVKPWFGRNHAFSNGILLLVLLGWVLFIPAFILLWGVYGANRRKV